MFGSAYAMNLTIERNALANTQRMPPLRSSNFSLNLHMGNYDRVVPGDYLGKNKAFDVDENLFRTVEKAYE